MYLTRPLATIIISFLSLLILLASIHILSSFKEPLTPQYLDHKTKCFSCEKQVLQTHGPKYVWMAQPAKSFDAEREAIIQKGSPEGGFLAKTIKYY